MPHVISAVFPLIDRSHFAGAAQASIILCQFSPVADLEIYVKKLVHCGWYQETWEQVNARDVVKIILNSYKKILKNDVATFRNQFQVIQS